jgi:xanthine dehydrogenase accessory factor
MNERALVWLEAARLAREGRTAGMATVSRRRGSLPMARDAKLVACDDGRHWGTVGGGCTEADVIGQALEAAAAGRPAVARHTLNADLAGDVGLSCGGTAEFFLEPIVSGASAAAVYEAVGRAILTRTPAEVRTSVDWAAGPAKQVRAGEETLGLGTMPATVGDESGVFVESVPRLPRVIVFGAGHVGVEIARLAARAGFYVVAVDDRDEFADARRLPGVDEVIVEDFRTALDRLLLDADDYVLATTRGHSYDAYIVERTAASGACYVGMLGSRRKKEVIWKALRAAGVPESALARVRVPIGEPIGADTPAEIAVIRIRRSGDSPGK